MTVDSLSDVAVSHFRKAYMLTLEIEGMYSKDPLDPGGETFLGISRYWHPSWPGWAMIDRFVVNDLPIAVMQNLYGLAEKFYKVQFWDRCHGDKLASMSAAIAEKVFDTAVNLSVTDSIRWLQEAINLLNLNAQSYPDMLVDGRIGKITIGTLERYLITRPGSPEQNERRLLTVFSFLQGNHYINQMRQHPEKERFRGWFDRASV